MSKSRNPLPFPEHKDLPRRLNEAANALMEDEVSGVDLDALAAMLDVPPREPVASFHRDSSFERERSSSLTRLILRRPRVFTRFVRRLRRR
jgi:hypothetical protein